MSNLISNGVIGYNKKFKENGLEKVKELYSLSLGKLKIENTYELGNSKNNLELIKQAGIGIENAGEDIKNIINMLLLR
ncbi:MAG: hypothetical protein ACK5HR_01965 [Mycoplasmatales bacterium]